MTSPTSCPPLDALQRLVRNEPEQGDPEAILRHLESCGDCTTAVRTLDDRQGTSADTFRSPLQPLAPEEAEVLDRMMVLLRRCGPDSTAALTASEKCELESLAARSLTTATFAARHSFLAPPEAADELGRLGGFRILRQLGAGGMGIVFEAEDLRLRRRVAVKVLRPELAASPEARQRFLIEARAVAAIEHERIVVVYQVGEQQGVPFFAMQLLQGESLADRLAHTPLLQLDEVLRIGLEIAEGLAAAHRRGLIHRDIKPANIWLDAKDDRVKLVDFGLAREVAGAGVEPLTGNGALVGTPAYMSPEQADSRPLDARTDLFSLGSVLYRLLTGRLPFPGTGLIKVLTEIARTTPPAVVELRPDVPPAVGALVFRLLEKDRERRPATADAVVLELRRLRAEAAQMPKPLPAPDAEGSGNRRRRMLRFAAAAACVLLFAGIWVVVRDRDGKEITRVEVPSGGTATLVDDRPKPVPAATAPPATASQPALPASTAESALPAGPKRGSQAYYDRQRTLAEWAIGLGGEVGTDIAKLGTVLPEGPFEVKNLVFRTNVVLTEADAEKFIEFPALEYLWIERGVSKGVIERLGRLTAPKTLHLELREQAALDEWFAPLSALRSLTHLTISQAPLTSRVSDGLFEHLQGLTRLESLDLYGNHRIRGHELGRLRGMENLTYLHLGNCTLDDEGLKALSELPQLRIVMIGGDITDAGLAHLSKLTRLEKLSIGRSPKLTDTGFAAMLPHWPNLQELILRDTPVTDGLIETLAKSQRLRKLGDYNGKFTSAGRQRLRAALPDLVIANSSMEPLPPASAASPKRGSQAYYERQRELAEWAIGLGGEVGTDAPKSGTTLPAGPFEVKSLVFRPTSRFEEADAEKFGEFPALELLWIQRGVTKVLIEHVGSLSTLKKLQLELTDPAALDEWFAPLTALRSLEHLSINHAPEKSRLTDGIFETVQQFPRLVSLNLYGNRRIRGHELGRLPGLKNLSQLNLGNCTLDDDGLKALAELPELRKILISGSFTDAGLAHLSRLKQLEYAHINGGDKLTDAGFSAVLPHWPNLGELSVREAKVTDALIDTLEKSKHLRKLVGCDGKFTAAGRERLLAALPNLDIVRSASDAPSTSPLPAPAP